MTTLNDLLSRPSISIDAVRSHLGSIAPGDRVRQATNLDRERHALLWDLAASSPPVTSEDLVPSSLGAFAPVPFEGQNNQPLFRSFQKVFYRLPDGSIAGRNVGSTSVVAGHGYYTVVPGGPDGVFIDYTKLPTQKPSDWPRIVRNDRGVSIAVYGFMKDYLRRVNGRIFIGKAVKPVLGTMGYFVLARGD